LPTQEKIDRVQELKDKLERSTITVTTDYTGITVNEMTDLRSRMRSAGVEFTVVKNTLMYLASEEAQRPNVKEIVQGPTAVALGYDDPLDVAKAVSDYIRTSRSALAIRGAVMGDGPVMSAADVARLAALPPKPQLVANLLGQLQSPIQRLLGVLNGPLVNLDRLIQARITQLEQQEAGA
jgi:large subunit ribosomal protein L10